MRRWLPAVLTTVLVVGLARRPVLVEPGRGADRQGAALRRPLRFRPPEVHDGARRVLLPWAAGLGARLSQCAAGAPLRGKSTKVSHRPHKSAPPPRRPPRRRRGGPGAVPVPHGYRHRGGV